MSVTFCFVILNVAGIILSINNYDSVLLPPKRTHLLQLNSKNPQFTLINYMTKSELTSCIIDDMLKIKCDMVLSNCSIFHQNMSPQISCQKKFLSDLSSLLSSEEFSDLTLVTSTGDIKAHKTILSARSPVFRSMLSSPMVEKMESRIEIPDFSLEIVREMLKFLYSGTLPDEFEHIESCFELYKISHKYQQEELVKHCSKLIALKLDPNNALEIFMFANLYDDQTLKTKTCELIKINMGSFVKTEEFKNIKMSQPHIIAEIFSVMGEIEI